METIIPHVGELWYHYKHNPLMGVNDYLYEIIGLGYGTEDDVTYVVYKPLYDSKQLQEINASFYIRPLTNFLETVTLSDGTSVKRFTKKVGSH